MQEHAGEKQNGEQANRQLRIACEDQKNGLNFAMQKPLENYQRQEG